MIDRVHALPITRQARELGISRGSVYYLPRPVPASDLAIMRRIDELHMDHASVSDARSSIGRYLTFDNSRRPHSSLDRKTPDQAYFSQPLLAAA